MEYGFGGMFPMGGGGGMRNQIARVFDEHYHVYSFAMKEKSHLEDGDKIFLPPSALDALARMQVEYPMLFELKNPMTGKHTHCGVLEFSAEEGRCYIPFWMMEGLFLEEGALIAVKNVALSKATYVKFQAQAVDFLEISNPRAVLEVTLRKFTCLTEGDMICISHAGHRYYLEVREVRPNGAASIIETDCNVDFDEPVGYKTSKYAEYERKKESIESKEDIKMQTRELQKAKAVIADPKNDNAFKAFTGTATRIDGKKVSGGADMKSESKQETVESTTAPLVAPVRQSLVGDKYSKKKSAVSAFTGAVYKLK